MIDWPAVPLGPPIRLDDVPDVRPRRRQLQRHAGRIATLENAMLLVDRREQLAVPRHHFRAAKQQIAAWCQRIVERGNHPRLQFGVEVDQQIAAGDQVDAGEWRIADHAMR